MPWVHPRGFAAALRLSQSVAPTSATIIPADFDGAALFDAAAGTLLLHSAEARELFNLLFIGNGAFPLLFTQPRPSRPLVNANPRRLVVLDGSYPGDGTPTSTPTNADKDLMIDLCSAEVKAKRYLGPFSLAEAIDRFGPGIVISSAFIVRRTTAVSTKNRLVHNASGPGDSSINDGIEDPYAIQLDHSRVFQERLRHQLRRAGDQPVHLCVSDISKAYRRFGIRQADVPLLGLRCDAARRRTVPFFDGKRLRNRRVRAGQMLVYFDTRLPFGVSSSVSSCVRVTCFVRDLVRELLRPRHSGIGDVCAYIDDFGSMGTPVATDDAVRTLRATLERIGCPENAAKLDTPSRTGTMLGLYYDLDARTVSLPDKKKRKYADHLQSFLSRAQKGPVRLSEIKSVVGKLVHASGVYAASTIFYQRLLAVLRQTRSGSVTLHRPELDDIRWWLYLLQHTSGVVPLDPAPWLHESEHRIYTDASGWGWGCCFKGQWMKGQWPADIRQALAQRIISISDLELVALNIALETWRDDLAGQRLHLRCDNTASVANVTARASSIPRRASLLRRLFVIAAAHGIQIRSTYINTKRNEHADALSRNDLDRFFSLPQDYPLQRVRHPKLDAIGLLLDPDGPLNPSSPTWAALAAPSADQLWPSGHSARLQP